jgi:hypothetical protein
MRYRVSDAQARMEEAQCVLMARQAVAGRTVAAPPIGAGGTSGSRAVSAAGSFLHALGQSAEIDRAYQSTLHLCLQAQGWVWE